MQIPEDMLKVEVQNADEICIGDFIIGNWNDIYVETFTHATSIGEVRALDFSLATLEDLQKLSSTELNELRNDSYILVEGVYRLRVPPPEVRGTVIDILEFRFASSEISVPQRAIWTDGNRWATDTGMAAKSSDILRWNLVAAAHKPR